MTTPEEIIIEINHIRETERELKTLLYDTVMEIPIKFLTEKGFVFTEHKRMGDPSYTGKDSQYSFTCKNKKNPFNTKWPASMDNNYFYNQIAFSYPLKGKDASEYHVWSFFKTTFETFYNRNLKKDFEPKK